MLINKKIQFFVQCAEGKIWEKLSEYLEQGLNDEVFWKLGTIYGTWFPYMSHLVLWNNIAVSVVDGEDCKWGKIANLGQMSFDEMTDKLQLLDGENHKISPSNSLDEWEQQGTERPTLPWHMNALVLLMSSLIIENNKLALIPCYPECPEDVRSQYTIADGMPGISGFIISYKGELQDTLTAQSTVKTINKNHPLCEIHMQSKF